MPFSLDPLHPSNHTQLSKNPLEVFLGLPDPRGTRNQQHKLFDIFAIAICAIISGANDWVKVEVFGRSKEEWLRTFLELPNGIPSHDTFDRVFRYVDPNEFEKGAEKGSGMTFGHLKCPNVMPFFDPFLGSVFYSFGYLYN